MDKLNIESFASNKARSHQVGRQNSFSSANNAPTEALQALLQKPVDFVPATSLTYNDQRMSIVSALNTPIVTTIQGDAYQQNGYLQVQDDRIGLPHANTLLATQTVRGQWLQQASRSSPSKGFFNRHVMCYRNSMIQALLHAPKLVNWMEECHPSCAQGNRCTICALRSLSIQYWHPSYVAKDIDHKMDQLESNLRGTSAFTSWSWRRQQDANEFFLHLVNSMIERHPKYKSRNLKW